MSGEPVSPPLDGSIGVLPGLVDFHATYNSDHPWVRFPNQAGDGVTSVSFKQLADATHRIAHVLRPLDMHTGRPLRQEREMVAVLVHCDAIFYSALLLGMLRAGLIPFPMSPRNSAPAVVDMFKRTSCHRVIVSSALVPLVEAVMAELFARGDGYELQVDELPDMYEVFPSLQPKSNTCKVCRPEPYPDVFDNCSMDEPALYIHSSGSTGFPKPVPQTHRTLLEWCHTDMHKRSQGFTLGGMALPTFHTTGIYVHVLNPLVTGWPIGLFTPQARPKGQPQGSPVVPTPEVTLDACRRLGCGGLVVVPTFVEAWAQSEENMKVLASMKYLAYGGGPLSERNGTKLIAAGVKLYMSYGATEIGAHTMVLDPGEHIPYYDDNGRLITDDDANVWSADDWSWLVLDPRLKPLWSPQGDGSFELQLLTCDTHHPSVINLPDGSGYATGDLFVPHPTKRGLWRITGRKDDVIVLGTGEKVVPLQQEGFITSHRMVGGVVMFGRGRNQCGVLVEPHPDYAVQNPSDEASLAKFRNLIWPVVEEANRIAPTFARIFKEMIILTEQKRPLPRAAKGTIVRRQALALYEPEIENLYRTVEDSADVKGIAPPASWAAGAVEAWLINQSATFNGGMCLQPTIDLFDQGFDSLHATFLRNRIIGALRNAQESVVQGAAKQVTQNFVFEHPTLRELADTISALASGRSCGQTSTVADIASMLERYSAGLPNRPAIFMPSIGEEIVVLLTGSTGNVGSHLLAALLAESRVQKVYTLNRPLSAIAGDHDRQHEAFEERNLPVGLLSQPSKYIPLYGDLSVDGFGLERMVYEEIVNTVTHVIHNAWKVDFNHSLRAFEPLISGTRRLVDACYAFAHPVAFLFSSSESVGFGWDSARGPIPEEPLCDPKVASASGYGASKYIAENILARASTARFRAVSLRIGQICGAQTTGAWSTREWVPILVKSSIALGALPDLDESVTWVPMDTVAHVFVDLVVARGQLPPLLNVVHPHGVPWRSVFENVSYNLKTPLPFIPASEWLSRLENLNPDASQLERVPAIKLLEFFRGIFSAGNVHKTMGKPPARFSTVNLVAYSPAARGLEPIGSDHAKSWVQYWESQNFLDDHLLLCVNSTHSCTPVSLPASASRKSRA